jgi:DNA-binding NarL/FixJ family response regulator
VRTVLVADARPVVAQGLAAALTGHPLLEAAAACTDAELVAALETRAPGVIVVPLGRDGRVPDLLRCAVRTAPARTDVVVVGSPRWVDGEMAGPWAVSGIRAVLPGSCTVQELAEGIVAIEAQPDVVRAPQRSVVAEHPGAHRPARPRDALASLTAREHEVLGLLAQGRSTREIADTMTVSVNTVRTHVNVLLHKLGVHSRLRAVALFTDGTRSGRTSDGGLPDR